MNNAIVLTSQDIVELAPMVTMRSLGKAEIEDLVRSFIETNLEYLDSGTLHVYLKQLEYAVKTSIEQLKERAFDSIGHQLGGLSSGTILGHDVSISYPGQWVYSSAVEELKSRHEQELAALQEKERTGGLAKKVSGSGRITVTLRSH